MNSIVVQDSPTHGRGVFALRNFAAGEVVVPWTGAKFLNKTELSALSDTDKQYVSEIPAGRFVLFAEPACFVNHSCEPNTAVQNDANVAVRDIQKGEEITTDYTLEGADIDFVCQCESEKCRSGA